MLRALRSAALGAALAAPSAAVRAEALYVVEQLVVGVNSAPDGQGARVAAIRSGDRVEVLARDGDEAHVRLASGQNGWVKAAYLSAEKPLRLQLAEQAAQLAQAREELTGLQSRLAAAERSARSAPRGAAPAASVASQAVVPAARPIIGMAAEPAGLTWQWVAGAAAVALAGGFALGWRALDRRIRRKYGGVRIY